MAANSEADVPLEIGHVLFMDVVGYSKLLINEQRELQQQLSQIVRDTEPFRSAETAGKLIRLPVGDGMALVFFDRPEAPVLCALEISKALKENSRIQLRMGIHSGPVNQVRDVNDRTNIAGAGVNIAQRVMDCADGGHILLSKRVAEDLAQSRQWQPHLYDLGDCEVKHGVNIFVVNLYGDGFGNSQVPEKIKKTREQRIVAEAASLPGPTSRRRNLGIAAGVAAAVALASVFLFVYPSRSEKSIAVLPFENFSDEKENAFFADGIQDDILTSLARIRGLRVISRTSVMGYRGGKSQNLRTISKELDVNNVLEGSVRRESNRVVVTVQLIDARHDRHLWANRYDRPLADSLGLQGELAEEIADALRVTLSPEEKARVEKKPTGNADAYVVYLQANHIQRNPDTLLEDFKKAEQLYLRAITLDPTFALAHARLASTQAQIYHFYEPLDSWKSKARAEADLALRLQPNLAEAHLALGQCDYWMEQDYDRALQEFATAGQLSPNNADIGELIAAIKRRQGHWQDALDAFAGSHKIDPQNPNVVRNLLFTNTALRRWPEAYRWAAQMRAMAPASLVAKTQSGYVDFWWKGDTRLLKSLLSQVPAGTDPDGQVTSCRWDVAMIDRDFAAARTALQTSPLNEMSYTNAGPTPKSFLQGCIELAEGKQAQAQKSFELARPNFEKAVEEAPLSADRHANLGWFYAFAGRKDEAIREGRRAVELKPESKDAFDGAIMNCYLALIYARVGENQLAISLIERLLKTPGAVDSVDYSVTVNDLKSRWEWDPIRRDPRFQKLIAQPIQ
ncbi:MAG TPA: adenylate/guanylate cyclase domain-containing protein [Chthoniobacterales bacterium]|nr:adenylate/guanylate cyclase domain-containing protein [Chthoniobacterales bacterium]